MQFITVTLALAAPPEDDDTTADDDDDVDILCQLRFK